MKKVFFIILMFVALFTVQTQAQEILFQNNQIKVTNEVDGIYLEPVNSSDWLLIYVEVNKADYGYYEFSYKSFLLPLDIVIGKTVYLTVWKYNLAGLNLINQNTPYYYIGTYSFNVPIQIKNNFKHEKY